MSHESLDEFYRATQIFGPTSSSGERQAIEQHIRDALGKEYYEIDHPFCACSNCAAVMGDVELWKRHLLSSLAISFNILEEMQSGYEDEDRALFMEDFDAGYSLGRLVSEYFLKARIEEDALRGIAAQEAVKARTAASGQSSSGKRHKRIEAMLENMETLVAENPALVRFGIENIADLAIQDAALQAPDLWSQGQGQKRDYLDELKSDLRYRSRFEALMKTA